MYTIKSVIIPTYMTTSVFKTQLHTQLISQFSIKGFFSLQTSFTLRNIPTEQSQHILYKYKHIRLLHII